MWPHSNETFVPAPELLIFIYIKRGLFLTLRTGVGQVHKQSIFKPGGPQCANACGFFNGQQPKKRPSARAEAVVQRLRRGGMRRPQ